MNEINQELFEYISACPTAYQAAAHTADLLEAAGYTRLCENDGWKLLPGHGYFVTRNFSSLIAFRLPGGAPSGYMISAAHGDSPCFKIKESAELSGAHYTRLSAERYGGMLCASWMDRPLSIAGRVVVRAENGIETRFAPVGKGNINFRDALAACVDAGVEYVAIEQDDCYGECPFDCLKTSRENTIKFAEGIALAR